jgi:hypothetical protein
MNICILKVTEDFGTDPGIRNTDMQDIGNYVPELT